MTVIAFQDLKTDLKSKLTWRDVNKRRDRIFWEHIQKEQVVMTGAMLTEQLYQLEVVHFWRFVS